MVVQTRNSAKQLRLQSPSVNEPSQSIDTNLHEWKDFPILNLIFEFLYFNDIKNMSEVCQNWNQFTISHRFQSIKPSTYAKSIERNGRVMRYSPQLQAGECLESIKKYSKLVKKLSIDRELFEGTMAKFVITFENLTTMQLTYIRISPSTLSTIAACCQKLEHFSTDCVVFAEEDIERPNRLHSIKFSKVLKVLSIEQSELDLASGIHPNFLINHTNVESLNFFESDELFLQPFLTNYPKLTQLRIGSYSSKVKNIAMKILELNPQISKLNLIVKSLSHGICSLVFNHMPNLQDLSLEANGINSQFSTNNATIDNLRVLDLGRYIDKTANLSFKLLSTCPNLGKLIIFTQYCPNEIMNLIARNCSNLRDLTLITDPKHIAVKGRPSNQLIVRNDFELISRNFICANNLKYLKFENFWLPDLDISLLRQFQNLKKVDFEINMNYSKFKQVEGSIREYLAVITNATSVFDYYNNFIKASIRNPNSH